MARGRAVLLNEIINDPDLRDYRTSFNRGYNLFLEGDDSTDLYILVSGEVEVLKGDKVLTTVSEPGALFGEMSFLLEERRTAGVRARDEVEVIRIPGDQVESFLDEHPQAARLITKLLARRLNETSKILYGFREFVDQIPDAVMITDGEGKALTWNDAAQELYGLRRGGKPCSSLEDVCQDRRAFRDLIDAARRGEPVVERVVAINHSQKGVRHISTSMTVLYDGSRKFQGVLSIGRDVTSVKRMERRLKRFFLWLAPLALLAAALAAVIVYGFPYFLQGRRTISIQHREFKTVLAKDFFLLKKLITDPLLKPDQAKTTSLMREFFELQDSQSSPYTGLVLLDRDKVVIDAYSPIPGRDSKRMVGTTYGRLHFEGDKDSLHKVLTVYRRNKKNNTQYREVDIAFELLRDGRTMGWLLFQVDPEKLKKQYGLTAESLRELHFARE